MLKEYLAAHDNGLVRHLAGSGLSALKGSTRVSSLAAVHS